MKTRKKKQEELKTEILNEYQNGNIVILDNYSLKKTNLKEFINQSTEGILYDLNRNENTILTFINSSKWINDFAACKVITELKKQNEIQRIEGVLLGLSIAKKAWGQDLGRNEIYENEILYKEELKKLEK